MLMKTQRAVMSSSIGCEQIMFGPFCSFINQTAAICDNHLATKNLTQGYTVLSEVLSQEPQNNPHQNPRETSMQLVDLSTGQSKRAFVSRTYLSEVRTSTLWRYYANNLVCGKLSDLDCCTSAVLMIRPLLRKLDRTWIPIVFPDALNTHGGHSRLARQNIIFPCHRTVPYTTRTCRHWEARHLHFIKQCKMTCKCGKYRGQYLRNLRKIVKGLSNVLHEKSLQKHYGCRMVCRENSTAVE